MKKSFLRPTSLSTHRVTEILNQVQQTLTTVLSSLDNISPKDDDIHAPAPTSNIPQKPIQVQENRVNVTGFNNGCGPHCFLHLFNDYFDVIRANAALPPFQHLLTTFGKAYQFTPTIENLRTALNAVPGYVDQEYAFGPVIRKHMADLLKNDEIYRNSDVLFSQFLTAMRDFLTNTPHAEGTNEALLRSNHQFFEIMKAQYTASNDLSEKGLDIFMREKNDDVQAYFIANGFDNYMETLGDPDQAIMFTHAELQHYARIMNINLEIFDGSSNRVSEHRCANPVFSAQLFNTGSHWNYAPAADLLPATIRERNEKTRVLPEERGPENTQIHYDGWQTNNQPYITRVQQAIRSAQQALGPQQATHSAEQILSTTPAPAIIHTPSTATETTRPTATEVKRVSKRWF